MYNIGDIFYFDKEYSKRADFCNNNNLQIVEIGTDENGMRYQIQEIPKPTEQELAEQEIKKLKQHLINTDYIPNKLAEAIAKYIETGDNTKLVELNKKYEAQLEERQIWRDKINELEVENGL